MRRVPDRFASLVKLAKDGDATGIENVLTAVLAPMYRVVCQVLGQEHADTEDVLQEAAIALMEALDGFREECSLLHFARRVALLTALNVRRRLRVRGQFVPISVADAESTLGAFSNTGTLMAERRRQTVLRLLDQLPSVQAEALAMHCILGCTVAETAEAVGVPINTVRGRLRTAKATLRNVIADDHELEEELRAWSRGTG